MRTFSRREVIRDSLPAVACLSAGALKSNGYEVEGPLAFQLYSLRELVGKDFPGTLRRVTRFGYRAVELCFFKDWAGSVTFGDFGPLAELSATDVRKVVQNAGMTAPSCHFMPASFTDQSIDSRIEWASETGVKYMTVTGALAPAKTSDEWKLEFERMNRAGERIRKAGLKFGYHTDVGRKLDGTLLFDEILRNVDPKNCEYQLEVSTTFGNGFDASDVLAGYPERFFSVHLRDLKLPPAKGYIASLPLGKGDVDWKRVLAGAKKGGVKFYIVEMVLQMYGAPPAGDPMEALKVSSQYLHDLEL